MSTVVYGLPSDVAVARTDAPATPALLAIYNANMRFYTETGAYPASVRVSPTIHRGIHEDYRALGGSYYPPYADGHGRVLVDGVPVYSDPEVTDIVCEAVDSWPAAR